MNLKLMSGAVRRDNGAVSTICRLCTTVPDGLCIGCDHEHSTREDALACQEARAALRAFASPTAQRMDRQEPRKSLVRALQPAE